ncbi:MAG: LL-diaminopimelate aminotransferase [Actinomycetota bacterium]
MRLAGRIENLPAYLFAELDRKVAERRRAGVDVISFAIGDPDQPTPAHIVDALREAAEDPSTHRYPSYYGLPEFRSAVADFYERRFGVALDPDTQVLPLIGSKEGIANLATAFVDPGEVALVPEPSYPVYDIGTRLAGGTPYLLPLTAANRFLPMLDGVPDEVAFKAKVLWMGYPSNPTAAVASLEDFEAAVFFARRHDLLLAHDNAYSEITFDGYVAPSVLEVPGAQDVAVEFGSLSKIYNMTGWRIGFVVGAAKAIEAIGRVKTNVDSGIFNAIQRAGVVALNGPQDHLRPLLEIYRRRRDAIVATFNEAGWTLDSPKGSLYVWVPVPEGETSGSFADRLLDEAGVVVAPGRGYGPSGEGYVRFSITLEDGRMAEGLERVRRLLKDG